MSLTFKEVAEIIKIIDASECEELILELEDFRLVIGRKNAGLEKEIIPLQERKITQENSTKNLNTSTNKNSNNLDNKVEMKNEIGTQILAPMVGTFYRRPSPDAEPFVELESKVIEGDPLCLIEVMKLYTTIEANKNGVIKQIGAKDGDLVEFDQLLFVIGDN